MIEAKDVMGFLEEYELDAKLYFLPDENYKPRKDAFHIIVDLYEVEDGEELIIDYDHEVFEDEVFIYDYLRGAKHVLTNDFRNSVLRFLLDIGIARN